MLRDVAPVGTDISEEHIASIIRVTRIGELGTLAVTSNRRMLRSNNISILFLHGVPCLLVTANVIPSLPNLVTLMMVICSSETAVLTRATLRNIPEDNILNVR
jgi:hypothetical protein